VVYERRISFDMSHENSYMGPVVIHIKNTTSIWLCNHDLLPAFSEDTREDMKTRP